MPAPKPVTLRVARAEKVIGMALSLGQCADALARLGLPVQTGVGVLSVQPPSYRFDLQIEEDLIEEVARMVGFDHLPATPPQAPITAKIRPESQRSPFGLRRSLAQLGYQETINYSFVESRWEHELAGNADPIRLLNPIASQMSVMRSSLLGSLLQVLKFNLDRKASRVRVFELGRVFLRDASVPDSDSTVQGLHQPMRVAGLACGRRDPLQWGLKDQAVDFFDVKGDLEALLAPRKPRFEVAQHPAMHPGRCAAVWLDDVQIGFVGELHPRWRQAYDLAQAPVMFELALDALLSVTVPVFQGVAKHQPVERDIAVLVDPHVSHDAVIDAVWVAPTQGLLRDVKLFDLYRPKTAGDNIQTASQSKSMALRLTLNSEQANLTDEQIDGAVQAVLANLSSQLGARQRA